jgi:hypothetical protein
LAIDTEITDDDGLVVAWSSQAAAPAATATITTVRRIAWVMLS